MTDPLLDEGWNSHPVIATVSLADLPAAPSCFFSGLSLNSETARRQKTRTRGARPSDVSNGDARERLRKSRVRARRGRGRPRTSPRKRRTSLRSFTALVGDVHREAPPEAVDTGSPVSVGTNAVGTNAVGTNASAPLVDSPSAPKEQQRTAAAEATANSDDGLRESLRNASSLGPAGSGVAQVVTVRGTTVRRDRWEKNLAAAQWLSPQINIDWDADPPDGCGAVGASHAAIAEGRAPASTLPGTTAAAAAFTGHGNVPAIVAHSP
ncbi:unnamed protein product [Lampetra fluviatilis]